MFRVNAKVYVMNDGATPYFESLSSAIKKKHVNITDEGIFPKTKFGSIVMLSTNAFTDEVYRQEIFQFDIVMGTLKGEIVKGTVAWYGDILQWWINDLDIPLCELKDKTVIGNLYAELDKQ